MTLGRGHRACTLLLPPPFPDADMANPFVLSS